MASNFQVLQKENPFLYNIASSAELLLHTDPAASISKTRLFGEKLAEGIYKLHGLQSQKELNFNTYLRELQFTGTLPSRIYDLFNILRKKGNEAAHQNTGNYQDSLICLRSSFHILKWYTAVYNNSDALKDIEFADPVKEDLEEVKLLEKQYKELEAKFIALQEKTHRLDKEEEEKVKSLSIQTASRLNLSEAETRAIIDEQLKLAGWKADTVELRHSKGTRPVVGENIAIAEWPVGSLKADYALFIGLELYGIVEAKRIGKDVIDDLGQAKVYSKKILPLGDEKYLGEWKGYKVPFMFATNARPYNKQIETKSGIWFLDGRESNNHPKCLQGWLSPSGLKNLYLQDIELANKKLKAEVTDYLKDNTGLGLRDYQIDAIKAVENKIIKKPEDARALVAMATGTGKTRTIIGLCYRLIKNNRFNRILFLVDRSLLGEQSADVFKDVHVADLQTFADIFDIQELKDKKPELDTRVHFATVQSLVKRIFYSEKPEDKLPVDTYDCIIIDEAHRGYTLDKEMDEEELGFKNQFDYLSKYKMVLDYFNAYRIGLTATPALHTREIFGDPVYRYTYRQAVIDGFLIDHEPPVKINTTLTEEGIVWKVGEKPKVYDSETNSIEELDALEDELQIEVEHFNKLVLTENWNKTVLQELANWLDPEGNEKTLIFAATDVHADNVVLWLKQAYEKIGIQCDDDSIKKITGSVYDRKQCVLNFKNEKYPNIVVTVDLLTTGIDVPKICNIVFLRRVKSRILYEQMLGRATRRADDIGKEVFKIFDAVRLYEALQDYTDMKPIVVNPETTFVQLVDELEAIKKEERIKQQINQILAKLQRKKSKVKSDLADKIIYYTQGRSLDEFINFIKQIKDPEVAIQELKKRKQMFTLLDEMKGVPKSQLISEHKDEYLGVERGYGKGVKPQDYLDSFQKYIEENLNKITALTIVCSRPNELTRKSLRELRILLDDQGFNDAALKTAWKECKNEEIAADIISFIRTIALGSALLSHEERIKNAMKKVKTMKTWSKVQLNWLEKIEKQLLIESIVDREMFDSEPFKTNIGGYDRLNLLFENQLDKLVGHINQNLYAAEA